METLKLYMCLVGCKPLGRHLEQHDIFFGIATEPARLIPQLEAFWPEAGRIHLDAWREVTVVDGWQIRIQARCGIKTDRKGHIATNADVDLNLNMDLPAREQDLPEGDKNEPEIENTGHKLYFLNLGGYQPGEFEEFHYKVLTVQENPGAAVARAKADCFFKENTGTHIDDKYGIDVDDLYNVEDILAPELKSAYKLGFSSIVDADGVQDECHIGYTKLSEWAKHL
ncbi:MAG TPA: DUF1543 domain-containing protein [Arachidicoccus sp.]|nr:DUF1543 domain-containing protein [Arachidicoccus sp.]